MSVRQSTFKVSSEALQGEGSYVVFRYMEFGLVLEAMKRNEDAAKGGSKTDADKEFSEKLLREAVVEWNWVDDKGAQLPLPSAGLAIERLLTNEVMWLVEQVTGKAQSKNSS